MRFKTLTLATASLLAISVPFAANAAKPEYGTWGYEPSAMDSSVKPGDDFWAYVNGNWDKHTQIAADRASAGPFVTLSDQSEKDVRQIVEQLAADPNRDQLGQQVGDYYASFMDTGAIEAAGTAPLKPYLAEIDAAKTRDQLVSLFVKPGFASPVDVGIDPDFKNPDVYSAFAGQSRLGLPSREYYLEDSAKMKAHRAAYRDYIVTIEKLAGLPGGEAAADRIIALETALSQAQWKAADRRDIDKIYNPMTRAQLIKLAPQFDWNMALSKAGLGSAKTVIVTEPSAVAGAGKILASTPLSTWKEWLAFRFVSDHATVLPKAIDDARFAFYSKELSGVQQQRDRWKRGVAAVNGALGEGVGEIYVKSHYPSRVERQMSELIGNLTDAYRERISSNTLDGRRDPQGGAREARFVRAAHRPPGEVHRLLVDEGGEGRSARQFAARRRLPVGASAQALPQAGRPDFVGHVPADHQRLLQPAGQPDHLPGRDPAAAVLRPQRRSAPRTTARSVR